MPRIIHPPLPFSPHACLVTGSADGEFIDFERDFIGMDPRIVLRKEVVEEAARECCQMLPMAEVDALRLRVEGFAEKVAELQADLDAAKAFEERFGGKELEGKSLVIAKDEWHPQEEIEIEAATSAGGEGTPDA